VARQIRLFISIQLSGRFLIITHDRLPHHQRTIHNQPSPESTVPAVRSPPSPSRVYHRNPQRLETIRCGPIVSLPRNGPQSARPASAFEDWEAKVKSVETNPGHHSRQIRCGLSEPRCAAEAAPARVR
jgi:hypothetical protein